MKYKKIFLIILFFLFFSLINAKTLENKIEIIIENEIITSIDIINEINYLSALNSNFNKINYRQRNALAKESLIREKIKKIEVIKSNNQKLNESILNELLEKTYKNNGFNSLKNFEEHLISNNLNLEIIKKKIKIEALWNQLIFAKFSPQISINYEKIKSEVVKNSDKKLKSYNLSEILISVENSNDQNKKINLIKQEISKNGFENTALLFSDSKTSSLGGKVGWININSMNDKIKNSLLNLKISEITEPIFFSTGFIILKINDIKEEKIKVNINQEIERIIEEKKNQQLNQFSTNYFMKLKKNLKVNEI